MTVTSRTTPLGLRAANSWSGAPVLGLTATAWPARLDTARTTSALAARGMEARAVRAASPGQNGVVAWHALPGFGGWSAGPLVTDPVPDPWDAAWRQAFTVLLGVPDRRFVPVRLAVSVPQADLLPWSWSTTDVRAAVRMYPSALHPVPDGYVAVRAQLWDPERGTPAAWALLDVTANGHISTGLADEWGDVVVFLPQPRLRTGVALTAQRWPLTVSVRYGRLADLRVAAPPLLSSPSWAAVGPHRADLPTLDVIEAQGAGQTFATWTGPGAHTAFAAPDLALGGEVWLASAPQPPAVALADRETRLFITP